ncbi:MAG: hypothetical protein J2P21_30495 [Chloracidobacterium sp.]|nr:hypothetical protein [Chloracidobacterium sp.]
MIVERLIRVATLLLWFLLTPSLASAQSTNLLQNPSANGGANHWRAYGDATIEETLESNPYFTVRNRGYFLQDVILPEGSVRKYALLIGRVSSERINADGTITGLPYLYGYMMEGANPRGGRILSYLQGQQMLCSSRRENEWVTAWGIFQAPDGTGAIRFFLRQAERKDIPQNGSAARFDDLGIYLFDTEKEANAFVETYKAQTR